MIPIARNTSFETPRGENSFRSYGMKYLHLINAFFLLYEIAPSLRRNRRIHKGGSSFLTIIHVQLHFNRNIVTLSLSS